SCCGPLLIIPSFLAMLLSPPRSPLFPYTTLFRSTRADGLARTTDRDAPVTGGITRGTIGGCGISVRVALETIGGAINSGCTARRSEEHTSELQSRRDLVCRLLLEKKKVSS